MSSLTQLMAFAILAAKLPAYVPEYRFHPTRRWRFDFAWPDKKIALECEGGTWKYGRHNRPKGFEDDAEKYNEAGLLGWMVLRCTTNQIKDGRAIDWLERALDR
jgi:very-short-patch-repair endonuclease